MSLRLQVVIAIGRDHRYLIYWKSGAHQAAGIEIRFDLVFGGTFVADF